MVDYVTPAESIAGELVLAIHAGSYLVGAQLPSQTRLQASFTVSMATASSALRKVAALGLSRSVPGRGTYVVRPPGTVAEHPVLVVLDAASVCRQAAALPDGSRALVQLGGIPAGEGEALMPRREVDVAGLAGVDRAVLVWMGASFRTAALRIVGGGVDADAKAAVKAARTLLRGACRTSAEQPESAPSTHPL